MTIWFALKTETHPASKYSTCTSQFHLCLHVEMSGIHVLHSLLIMCHLSIPVGILCTNRAVSYFNHHAPGSVTKGQKYGLVSRGSVPAWLLLPSSGPAHSWLNSSTPGGVFAVMRLDTRRKVRPAASGNFFTGNIFRMKQNLSCQ